MKRDEHDPLLAAMASEGLGEEGSRDWKHALFERAYYERGGPFAEVVQRLGTGFSVLTYLPGNCMVAAAETVKARVQSATWSEYLKREKAGQTLENVWNAVSQIVEANERGNAGAIFHNLDFLIDTTRGGGYASLTAQSAVFGLVEGARHGVVFGMSDREEPELPSAIVRGFNDKIRIEEIPYRNFHRIMPRRVGQLLQSWGVLSEGTIWLIASRLRWLDPIRAYRVLAAAAENAADLDGLLGAVVASTCTVDYIQPEKAFPGDGRPAGFRDEEMSILDNDIVRPYLRWKHFRGSRDEYQRSLDRLPPGAILYGPPGTGKTYLARWIAREIELPVRIVSGGNLRSAAWGEAERNVRALFRDARRAAPCVLILDDADDLLPDRNKTSGAVAAAERAVVNEFLQQLQGLHEKLEGVLVILTTNRFDSLDPAAKARLPVHVRVPYPTPPLLPHIIETVGNDFGYVLDQPIAAKLEELFAGPIGSSVKVSEPLTAEDNRFSHREIRQAMRMLESWNRGPSSGPYHPTLADVERVRQYYRRDHGLPQPI